MSLRENSVHGEHDDESADQGYEWSAARDVARIKKASRDHCRKIQPSTWSSSIYTPEQQALLTEAAALDSLNATAEKKDPALDPVWLLIPFV